MKRNGFGSSVLGGRFWGCGVGAVAAVWAAQSVLGASVQQRVSALIAEAGKKPSLAYAQQKLAAAERAIAAAKLPARERGFLTADVERGRGRALVAAWQREPDKAELRAQAQAALEKALAAYEQLQAQCEQQANQLEAQLGDAVVNDPRYRVACGNVSRANYAMAWAEYSLGLCATTKDDRERRFKNAVQRFVSFTAEGYRKHPIVIDCFLGQALALHQLKRDHEVTQLLADATPDNTPAATYKQMLFLILQANQAQGSHLKVEVAAKQYFDSLPPDHRLDTLELEMAVLRAKSLAKLVETHSVPRYRERFKKRLREVANVVRPYGSAWATRLVDVMGKEATGGAFAYLTKAKEHFKAKQFADALKQAAAGLDAATTEADRPFLPDLRYAKAAAAWNLGKWTVAYEAAAEFLRQHPDDRRAGEVCRIAMQAALKARASEPPLPAATFLEFLDFAQAHFPNQPDVKRAPWYRANLLLQAGRYADAEAVLDAIGPKSPVFRQALYGRALAAYKQAETFAAAGTDAAREAAAQYVKSAAQAITGFAAAAKPGLPKDELPLSAAVADIAVATSRVWLDLPQCDHAAVLTMLKQTESLPNVPPKTQNERTAATAVALALSGDIAATTKLLAGLLASGAADAHMANALIAVADPLEREYDRRVKAGHASAAKRLAEQLAKVYTVLLEQITSQAGEHEAQEVAIRRRLARGHTRLGQHAQAIEQYEWLRKRVPIQEAGDVLRGLALAYQQTEQFDAAAETWSTLARGLKTKTDDWLEAQHALILCEAKAGRPDKARKLLQYFKLVHSNIASQQWKEKFQALEQELGAGGG